MGQDQDARVFWQGDNSPRSRPPSPGTVQERVVVFVVGHEDPPTSSREEELLIVVGIAHAHVPGRFDSVASPSQEGGHLLGNIVVEVETRHGDYAAKNASWAAMRASMAS